MKTLDNFKRLCYISVVLSKYNTILMEVVFMRKPNKSIVDALYLNSGASNFKFSKLDSTVCTARYIYTLYLDVMFPFHDVIQRSSLRDPSDVQQFSLERPQSYRS